MFKTLIIYESRQGTTEKMVKYLSLILGPAKLCRTEGFTEYHKHYDLYILGSPIYDGKVDEKILNFAKENEYWLKDKMLAIFCFNPMNGAKVDMVGTSELKPLKDILGDRIIYSQVIGGQENLQGDELEQQNSFIMEELVEFGLEVKSAREKVKVNAPKEIVKRFLENFLHAHNTCTLCTGYGEKVRGTTMEYFYKNGNIYMLTEGGVKFANILLNANVSICIHNSIKALNNLSGAQLNGIANLVDMNSREYNEALRRRGIKSDQLEVFPSYLNLLKVQIGKVEYVSHKFKELGYEAKQEYCFNI